MVDTSRVGIPTVCVFAGSDLVKQFVSVRLAIQYAGPAAGYSRNGLGLVIKVQQLFRCPSYNPL